MKFQSAKYLSCSPSPASQTGCPSQIEETWHLFLRQSFWLSCSTFLTSSFSPSESITRPISPVHFLLFELFSYLLPVCHSMLGPVGLSPSCLHPCGCLFVLLFISLLNFLSASSGHKCLRHCTRVLDTQVVISPSQDQVHSEVRG